MPGRQKTIKIKLMNFESFRFILDPFWIHLGYIFDTYWYHFLQRMVTQMQLEINAQIDTEKGIEPVAIEAKRGPKMNPKWSQKS